MTTTLIQLRRGSASAWTSVNPILADGEVGVEEGAVGVLDKVKIGDGSTSWSGLPYVIASGSPNGTASLDSSALLPVGQLPFAAVVDSSSDVASPVVTGSGSRHRALRDVLSVRDFNAKGDGKTSSSGSITTGTPDLTDPSNPYTSADVGKKVYVLGAGASGAALNTTILNFVNSGHVALSTNAGTTVTNTTVVWATNDLTAFQNAINAGGTIYVPNPTGQFYLIDGGGTAGGALTSSTDITLVGDSPRTSLIRFGPEGGTGQGFNLFQLTVSNQVITIRNLKIQGPDNIGSGGPPLDPGILGTSAYCGFIGQSGGTGNLVKVQNCHIRRFNFCGVSSGSYECDWSWFEGYGSAWRSMGPGAGDNGTSGYSSTKYAKFNRCRFFALGDPTGGSLYHAGYSGTSHDLSYVDCLFDTAASTSTGAYIQHYDATVSLANAARESKFVGCHFTNLGAMTGVNTAYNIETKISACTFDYLTGSAIAISGPVQVVDNTFTTNSGSVDVITAAPQGQSTGLTWGGQISLNRFRQIVSNGGTEIHLVGSSATTEYVIDNNTFEGATGSNGIYIWADSLNTSARVVINNNTFRGAPNHVFHSNCGCIVRVSNNRFLLSNGTYFSASTTAMARFDLLSNEFAGTGGSIFSGTWTVPAIINSRGNYGSQWVSRNVQNANYTVFPYDEVLIKTTDTAAITWTLPAASAVPAGHPFWFKNASGASTNTLTVAAAGTDTIDGAATQAIAGGRGRLLVESNGTNGWDILVSQ